MYRVTFRFENGCCQEVSAPEGAILLDIARKANIAIDAPCSGNASCGKCRVRLLGGSLDSEKTAHISDEEYALGWRLACVSRVIEDAQILVPDLAAAYRCRMKIAALDSKEELEIFEQTKEQIRSAGIDSGHDLKVVRLTMPEPSLDDTMPDLERLIRAVRSQSGSEQVKVPFSIVRKLAEMLRIHRFDVRCIYRREDDTVQVLELCAPEGTLRVCGLAVDIGTTTVSALLTDMLTGEILAKGSAGNGQIRYGADVINRIIESEKEGGRKHLQDAIIRETLNPLVHRLCQTAETSPDSVYRICIAGNTTMNHLLLGTKADPIRMEPFIPTFFELQGILAQDLGLAACPHAEVILAPNIGSYVGGDITAGTFASGIWNRSEFSLLVDLGTNGELVLGNDEFMISCACSAGPAFEGGEISCGMRAADGAIEACTIDSETMEPTMEIIGDEGQKPAGICGSGLIDVVSELFRCGIIDSKGKIVRTGKRIRRDLYGIGSYVLVFREDADSVRDIEISEVDIDSFIRAKGAIFSAIRTMLGAIGFTVDMIDAVYVSGGIGSGIRMDHAVSIGMLPDISPEKYHYIGNTSLAGAVMMLLSKEAEQKVTDLARNMTYMELSNEPSYMEEFVASCFLPHTDAELFPSCTVRR